MSEVPMYIAGILKSRARSSTTTSNKSLSNLVRLVPRKRKDTLADASFLFWVAIRGTRPQLPVQSYNCGLVPALEGLMLEKRQGHFAG